MTIAVDIPRKHKHHEDIGLPSIDPLAYIAVYLGIMPVDLGKQGHVGIRLPRSWDFISTEHPRWFHVVDQYKRVRIKCFYSPGGENSFFTVMPLFTLSIRYKEKWHEGDKQTRPWQVRIFKEGEKEPHITNFHPSKQIAREWAIWVIWRELVPYGKWPAPKANHVSLQARRTTKESKLKEWGDSAFNANLLRK